MIVKVLKVKSHGGGRPLGHYIVGAERGDGEKVKWAEATNCGGIENPTRAVEWIAAYNEQNDRSQNKSAHLIVSLKENEHLSREQWRDVESTLVDSLGMGQHPRVSAMHGNTNNDHCHIWLSRIEPERHHARHPHGEDFRLQAAALELEHRHSLEICHHTTNWEQSHEHRQEKAQERRDGFEQAEQRDRQARREQLHRDAEGEWATLGSVAAELSPRYEAARDAMAELRREADAIKKETATWEARKYHAGQQYENRMQSIGRLALTAHNIGLKPDKQLATAHRAYYEAEARLQELKPVTELRFDARADTMRRSDLSPRRIELEDVARWRSPEYAKAEQKMWEARRGRSDFMRESGLSDAYEAARKRGKEIRGHNQMARLGVAGTVITNDWKMNKFSREIDRLQPEKHAWDRDVKSAERKAAAELRKVLPAAKRELAERQEKAKAARQTLRAGRDKEEPLKDRFAAASHEVNAAFNEVREVAERELASRHARAAAANEELKHERQREAHTRGQQREHEGMER